VSRAPELPDLFAEALELDEPGRGRLLARLRAEDPPSADRLAALVAAAERADSVLDREPPGLPLGEPPPPPSHVGPYRILREIGRGGMGRVFLAEQEEAAFRRTVALKVVDRAASGEVGLRRFRDEVRILASLEHPGIARFLDGGQAPDGTWFLALEFIEGVDLLEHCATLDLDVDRRLDLFVAVLDAVAYAHGRGVVHRDLKPSNILVGADGRPRLLDFGISKLIERDGETGGAASASQTTRFEHRVFTPAYASPEQFRHERATALSDVFSLGVLLYEVLVGARPFGSETSSPGELQAAVFAGDPEPPSAAWRRVSHGRRALARDLDAICLKALAVDPSRRYASAEALAADLRAYREGRPVAARRGGWRDRATRFLRRRGGLLQTAALTLALAALLATLYWSRREQAPADPPPRPFPFSEAELHPIEDLESDFAMRPSSVEAGAELVLALTFAGRSGEAAVIVRRMREIPGREGDALTDYVDGMLASYTDQLQRALVLYSRALDGALQARRGDLVPQVRAARGYTLLTLGRREEAHADMEAARAAFAAIEDWASLGRVLNDLAIEQLNSGDLDAGERLLEQALAATRRAFPDPRSGQGVTSLMNLAGVAGVRGRPDIAARRQHEVLDILRASGKPMQDFQVSRAFSHLAFEEWNAGRAAEADAALAEVLARAGKVSDPAVLYESAYLRGAFAAERGRLDEVESAIATLRSVSEGSTDRIPLGLSEFLSGQLAAAQGRLDDARRRWSEARGIFLAAGDDDRARSATMAAAEAECAAGNREEARRLLVEVADRYRDRQDLGTAFLLPTEALLVKIDALSGKVGEASARIAALAAAAGADGIPADRRPAVESRLAFLAARAELALAERRPADAVRDFTTAVAVAEGADRLLRARSLKRDLERAKAAAT
jgi:tetratricopeptide (TPR) repeat protein